MKLVPSHRSKVVELFQAADAVPNEIQTFTEGGAFQGAHGEAREMEASLSPLYLSVKDGSLQCLGYDLQSGEWSLPLTCLPETEIQDCLVAGGGGLLCVNVSEHLFEEKLFLCNPLTQKILLLPPLNLRRNPVLMHLLVNPATYSCKVIVAGSSSAEGSLSKCTEVFDSETWKWTRVGNIPGPEFCLNEYQHGVCIDGILYCIAFLDDGSGKGVSGKGVLAFNVETGKWMSDLRCPLPFRTSYPETSNMQLLECDGELYLFSEREHDYHVDHCIEKLESTKLDTTMTREWKNVVKECQTGGRGRLSYPEYTCVPHGDGKICIFNTFKRKGVVHDIVHGGKVDLPSPPAMGSGEQYFYGTNPLSFTFQPRSFRGKFGENPDLDSQGTKVNNDLPSLQFSEDVGRCPTYLCQDMVESVYLKVADYENLSRMKGTSRSVRDFLESKYFYRSRGNARENEGAFTSLMFTIEGGTLQCVAFDLITKKWRRLPAFTCIPSPVNSLFTDYVVAGGGGLLCLTATDSSNPGTFLVYNPLTNESRKLPPSIFPRNPVLVHLLTNPATSSYKLIVAGSSVVEDPNISCVTEVFDSETEEWTVTGDIPGAPDDYALIEHQTGLYAKGFLYCIAHWRRVNGVKVVLAYDCERGEWLSAWHPLLPYPQETSPFGNRYPIAQLVVCDDEVYLFSETGHSWNKRYCLDLLNCDVHIFGSNHWSNMWTKDMRPKGNGSGMLVCVPHVSGKVCLFDKSQLTGVVYDIHENPVPQVSPLPQLPSPLQSFLERPEELFFPRNTVNFLFKPCFKASSCKARPKNGRHVVV